MKSNPTTIWIIGFSLSLSLNFFLIFRGHQSITTSKELQKQLKEADAEREQAVKESKYWQDLGDSLRAAYKQIPPIKPPTLNVQTIRRDITLDSLSIVLARFYPNKD